MVTAQFRAEPGFADAGFTGDQDQGADPLVPFLEELSESGYLDLPADEGGPFAHHFERSLLT